MTYNHKISPLHSPHLNSSLNRNDFFLVFLLVASCHSGAGLTKNCTASHHQNIHTCQVLFMVTFNLKWQKMLSCMPSVFLHLYLMAYSINLCKYAACSSKVQCLIGIVNQPNSLIEYNFIHVGFIYQKVKLLKGL